MAEKAKAKHAFGSSENLQNALNSGVIDAYDILFLDGDTKPKVGWIDKNGDVKIVSNETDLSGIKAELETKAEAETVTNLEVEVGKKANSEEVAAKYEEVKYEISDVPVGTLIDYRENEIRIMCPHDAEYHLQSVGSGGDANAYYLTLKTYVYDDNVVGYKEHLGNQVDTEILTDLKTDKYGRRYQPTWLALAKYDEDADAWTYYGANSTKGKYIGWDYRIDWFDVDGVVIASDCIRINLSNEECHFSIEPYYVGSIMKEVDTKIDTKIEEKIAEVESAYEVIEF